MKNKIIIFLLMFGFNGFGQGTIIRTLSSVDNTPDINKPVSIAQRAAIDQKKHVVSSIAELQAWTGTVADFDGTWKKKSGDVQSNGGAFAGTLIRVSSTVYWEREVSFISTKMFGVKGFPNDDTVPYQNAINCLAKNGGKMIHDVDNMFITSLITIPNTGTKNIDIDGSEYYILVSSPNGFMTHSADLIYLNMSNMRITAQAGNGGNCFTFKDIAGGAISPQYCKWQNITISGFNGTGAYGFKITSGVVNQLINVTSIYCTNGFGIESAENTYLLNCNAVSNTKNGIYNYNTENVTYEACTIIANGDNSVFSPEGIGYYNTVTSNIVVVASKSTTITKCKFKNAVGRDISLIDNKSTNINQNWIRPDHTDYCIFSKINSSLHIEKNMFSYSIGAMPDKTIFITMEGGNDGFGMVNIEKNYFSLPGSGTSTATNIIEVIGNGSNSSTLYIEKNDFFTSVTGYTLSEYININGVFNHFKVIDNKLPYFLPAVTTQLVKLTGTFSKYEICNKIGRYNSPTTFNYYNTNGTMGAVDCINTYYP